MSFLPEALVRITSKMCAAHLTAATLRDSVEALGFAKEASLEQHRDSDSTRVEHLPEHSYHA